MSMSKSCGVWVKNQRGGPLRCNIAYYGAHYAHFTSLSIALPATREPPPNQARLSQVFYQTDPPRIKIEAALSTR